VKGRKANAVAIAFSPVLVALRRFDPNRRHLAASFRHRLPCAAPDAIGRILARRFYAHLGNFAEAERWYRLGLQQYPRSRFAPQGHYELAELLFRQERYKEAIRHYGKALEGGLTPEQKREALLKIAEAFQKSGEPLEAARRFEEFAKTFREDERAAKAWFAAGENYRQAGRDKEALRCWEKVSANYPTSPLPPKPCGRWRRWRKKTAMPTERRTFTANSWNATRNRRKRRKPMPVWRFGTIGKATTRRR
jgi:tetratricopeptide (TPR) repeat protein